MVGTEKLKSVASLKKKLMAQLGATEKDLHLWENEKYYADVDTVTKYWEYIKNANAIKIIGDYDCDGICASHITLHGIKYIFPEKKVGVRIPRRMTEGYGINDTIVDEILSEMQPGDLIITVDNGIAAEPVLDRLMRAGFKVIVTDHHELRTGCKIPKADMIIDPAVEQLPNPFNGRGWCGAAVAYKLVEQMVSEEKRQEFETYAGLATIADCMELKEGNWGLVRKAIKTFRSGQAPVALKGLLLKMGQDPNFIDEQHFGFYLGPAFNAPGRLYDRGAIKILKYLHNPTSERAEELVEINNARKELRDIEYNIIKEEIEKRGLQNRCPMWISVPGLHEGIVGILAGKLTEEYKRPAIVVTTVENNPEMLKGSGRSYGKFNIFSYLSSMPSDIFTKMGGHKGAAGLSLSTENFERACGKDYQISIDSIGEELKTDSLKLLIKQIEIPKIQKTLDEFRPFGEGNIAPLFEIDVDLNKDNAKYMGENENHLLINGKYWAYKITHFSHFPNNLEDQEHFKLLGKISGSAYKGKETPTFNADEAFSIENSEEYEKDGSM